MVSLYQKFKKCPKCKCVYAFSQYPAFTKNESPMYEFCSKCKSKMLEDIYNNKKEKECE